MLGLPQHRRHRFAAALSALVVVGLVCVVTPVAANKQAAGKSKTDSSAACRHGNALFALGRFGAAEAAFEKDMETGATIKCGREGLAKIGHTYPCAAARSLAKNGEKAESNKAYIELLKVKPRKQCAREGADSSSDPDIWDWFKTASENALSAIGFVALVGLGLIALFLLLINLQARIPWLRDRFPASRVRRPAISIDLFGDSGFTTAKVGNGATALLKEKIESGNGRHALGVVSGDTSAEGAWIKTVGELGTQAKAGAAIVELLKSLLPRRRFKVSGEIQPAGSKRGPAISVELDRKLISKGGITLWAGEFLLPGTGENEVDTVRRLTTPAAAWISLVVTQRTGGAPTVTDEAMSWAKFKAGLEWQQDGDRDRAKKLYKSAIATDAENYAAKVNLALFVAGDGDYKEAVGLLEEALETIEGK
jgi:tetratricopeptide (TPR) repeat protein